MSTQEFNKLLIGRWKSEAENIQIDFKFNGMASAGFDSLPYTLKESGNSVEIDLPVVSAKWTVESFDKDRIVVKSQETGSFSDKTIELIRVN